MNPIKYPVMEQFYTIQGEGVHAGQPAYFIRLGGCDVGCVWCDVKESWPMHGFPSFEPSELLHKIQVTTAKNVVVTGGEPSLYPLEPLTRTLHHAGLNLWIETSGTGSFSGIWDWICLSPKKFKPPNNDWLNQADEFKLVVYHPSDLAWGLNFLPHLKPRCRLIVQPEWDRRSDVMPLLVDFAKNNPNWTISLQTHKYLGIP